MSSRFEACLIGFVWRPDNDGQPCHYDPRDTGGSTSWGMTYATYCGWLRNKKLAVPPLFTFSTLPRTAFIPCYKELFWDAVHGDDLPIGLDLMVFDFAVLSSPLPAIEALQACLGIKTDGVFGPTTLKAVQESAHTISVKTYHANENAHFLTCKTAYLYGNGWRRRSADALTQAQKDQAAYSPTSV